MNKIEDLYQNKKSQNFVLHLIRAYLPEYKIKKVENFDDNKKHKCSVCGHPLFSINEFLSVLNDRDKLMEDFLNTLKKEINGEELKREDHFIVKALDNAVQGYQGTKTDTYLCMDCLKNLLDFSMNKVLMGDKKVNYTVNDMNPITNPFIHKKPKSKTFHKNETKKSTLGDLESLKELKKKMENGNS